MDTIYRGDIATRAGRRNAWLDALFVDHAVLRLGWTNFAAVKAGALYRSNHPVPFQLEKFTRTVGLRTLVNLRGECRNGSDALSRDAARRLGLDFYDMALESRGAPQRDRILRIADIFRTMQRPALVHCKSGADRAGIGSALFVLIEGGTAAAARAQLSWRFGHIRQSNTGILDAFLDEYERAGEGRKPFLNWVAEDYDEIALRRAFDARSAKSLPRRIARFVNDRILARE
ncbi:MAG: protein tyrosine phosphatase [Acidiphilium sp. 37-64-53]|uniref:tyrosine-protein phosphatase n=1 Tax=Acidiphilium TaxID=522 RepID=UPI000BC6D16B|nr:MULTISPECIES: tyrosine-protein phosphatase [Acidiphilium]OYW03083.1 MAG: protein tyrosine phosphatase [Acidiphilium sp. 37-64-53]OZB30821.1 MAG: protein tyrosine phosphatase [Acidiphilium sp. 34-64-41]HQT85179.1 tyrosine-protein phosphatase [Acidiphilium rubrum]